MGRYTANWQRDSFYDTFTAYANSKDSREFKFGELFIEINTSTTESVKRPVVRNFFKMLETSGVIRIYNRDRYGNIVDDSIVKIVEYPLPEISVVLEKANSRSRKKALAKSIIPFIGMLNIILNDGKEVFSYPNTEALRWAANNGLVKKVGVGERREGIYKINKDRVSPYLDLLKIREVNRDLFDSYRRLSDGEEIDKSELEALAERGLVSNGAPKYSIDTIILEA